MNPPEPQRSLLPPAARRILLLVLLTGLFVLALGIRRYVVTTQYVTIREADVPFALESALQYRRVKMIHDSGHLPRIDEQIEAPKGVHPAEMYTVFVDHLQATLLRFAPDRVHPHVALRWIEAAVFSLGIPLLGLWGMLATGRWSAGIVGALFYAVAISSVQRSTGAELSTENTAFPFLIAHFLLNLKALADPARARWRWGSAAALACAVSSWDLIQFYLLVWAGWGLYRVLRHQWTWDDPAARTWRAEWIGLIAVALLVPYHRAHGFLFSPAAMAGLVVCGLLHVRRRGLVGWAARPALWIGGAVVLAVGVAASGYYTGAYGHFLSLVWAKIVHLNVKPLDPSRLTFEQRVMWTPALHSPTILLTIELLLVLLCATIPAVIALARWRSDRNPAYRQPVLIGFIASLAAFVFFVRFHVYVALFAAMAAALWWGRTRSGPGRAWWPLGLLSLALFLETVHTLRGPWQTLLVPAPQLKEALDGRPPAALWLAREGVYYQEQKELTAWLAKNASPAPVLAGFGVSGAIAAYGKCGIVLHPKFETPTVREKVRRYAQELFTGTIKSFRDWADTEGAVYYVHSLGAFATNEPTLQLRYMADAMKPPANAPVRDFEAGKDDGLYFRTVFSNRKYHVLRLLTRAEEIAAGVATRRARQALERGDLDTAEAEATVALQNNPAEPEAQKILRHVLVLRQQGFSAGDAKR